MIDDLITPVETELHPNCTINPTAENQPILVPLDKEKAPEIRSFFFIYQGGRRGSNPQHLDPQSSTLPLSYAHHNACQFYH